MGKSRGGLASANEMDKKENLPYLTTLCFVLRKKKSLCQSHI